VTAAQEEPVRRTRANGDDLAKFFTARDRAETIEQSAKERIEALQEQANGRRDKQLVQRARKRRDLGAKSGLRGRLPGRVDGDGRHDLDRRLPVGGGRVGGLVGNDSHYRRRH
jgi:hypothetical protein